MSTYRKRPIPVQARQLTPETYRGLIDVLTAERFAGGGEAPDGTLFLEIRTLEGVMRASQGDWILWGIKDAVWPVRADIFAETYERVPDSEAGAEERIARRLAAHDYLVPDEDADDVWWDSRRQDFREDYLANARRVIALVQAETQPPAPEADREDSCTAEEEPTAPAASDLIVKRLRAANRRVRSVLLANADRLSTPFTDDPGKNPWDTFVRPAMNRLQRAVNTAAAALAEAQPTTNPTADSTEEFDYPRDPDAEEILNTLPPEAQRRIRAELAAEARQDGAQS